MRIVRIMSSTFRAVCLAALALSPTSAAAFTEGLNGYSVASWTEADGQPLGSVYSIVQDEDGYLWVGCDVGLLRFDGWKFLPWNAISETPLPETRATVLASGQGGALYVAFAGNSAVYSIRGSSARRLGEDNARLPDITSIAEDGHGTIWVVAAGALHRWGRQQWERVPVDAEGSMLTRVVSVRPSRAGGIWVGTTDGLFSRVTGSDLFERVPGRPRSPSGAGEWVWDIAEGPDGSLWTTDMAAGFKVRTATATQWEQGQPRVMGYRLLHDQSRNVWIGTVGEGLWRVPLDGADDVMNIERITLGTGLGSNAVLAIVRDKDQNVWIGTTVGLHRLTRRTLTSVSDVGLAVSVDDVAGLGVLVGSSTGLVAVHQPGDRTSRFVAASGLWVTRVHRGRRGGLWIATTSGTYYSQDDGRGLVQVLPHSARTITSDANGVVWLASREGVYRADSSSRVVPFVIPSSWGMKQIVGAFADSSGRLWVTDGTGGAGLIEGDGSFHPFGVAQGWQGWLSTAIFEDREQTVWIGTRSGLVRFKDGRFDIVGPADGLPSDRIGAIVDDDHGYLWLNLDVGLVRLKRDEFAAVIANRNHRPKYHIYDASDGLSGAAIVNLRAARSSDGRLWFIRGGGLTTIDPRALDQKFPARRRPTQIDAILADDRQLQAVDGVAIPAGTKTLQISYSALELTTPQRLRFRYRLEGFDVGWRNVESSRQAFYTNLPPRSYTFRVEAAIDGEDWVNSSTWQFTLEPKFWQTYWFYSAVMAALLVAVWATWRIRLGVVRHEFALVLGERTRLSREIHDTLLQSLAGLTLQLDKVARLTRTSPELAANQLLRMRRYVEANIRDARTSIWNLRSPILEAKDLAAALEEFARSLLLEHTTALEVTVVGDRRRIDSRIENHLLRIGQEAMTNAIHHAGAGRIELQVQFAHDVVAVRIIDNGRGFSVDTFDKNYGHYGLASMRERAQEIGGSLEVSSQPGRGTQVEAVVPLRASHEERRSA